MKESHPVQKISGNMPEMTTVQGRRLLIGSNHGYSGESNIIAWLLDKHLLLNIVDKNYNQDGKTLLYEVPVGTIALSGFLNSTTVDKARQEKRYTVLSNIYNKLSELSSNCIAVQPVENTVINRKSLALDADAQPVFLPIGIHFETMQNLTDAENANLEVFRQLVCDIVQDASSNEKEELAVIVEAIIG